MTHASIHGFHLKNIFKNGQIFKKLPCSAAKMLSAANIPDFIALCVPLTFGTFKNPASHPIRTPPGNVIFGIAEKKINFKNFSDIFLLKNYLDIRLHLGLLLRMKLFRLLPTFWQ